MVTSISRVSIGPGFSHPTPDSMNEIKRHSATFTTKTTIKAVLSFGAVSFLNSLQNAIWYVFEFFTKPLVTVTVTILVYLNRSYRAFLFSYTHVSSFLSSAHHKQTSALGSIPKIPDTPAIETD